MSQTNVMQQTDSLEEEEREQRKQKKQKSRRPASLSAQPALLEMPLTYLLHRYGLQATEVEGMAVSPPPVPRLISSANLRQT